MTSRILKGLALIAAIASFIGMTFALDGRWAKAEDVDKLAIRLEQKIAQDRARDLQQRQWTLEDRYGNVKKMPKSVSEEYRNVLAEREQLLKSMQNKEK
jgi:hypothetical protein